MIRPPRRQRVVTVWTKALSASTPMCAVGERTPDPAASWRGSARTQKQRSAGTSSIRHWKETSPERSPVGPKGASGISLLPALTCPSLASAGQFVRTALEFMAAHSDQWLEACEPVPVSAVRGKKSFARPAQR